MIVGGQASNWRMFARVLASSLPKLLALICTLVRRVMSPLRLLRPHQITGRKQKHVEF